MSPPAPFPSSGNTVNVTVGPNFFATFSPSTVNILVGDTVRWTWASSGHNVRSGSGCAADGQYCSPNDTNCVSSPTSSTNTTYSHTFNQPGTYSYFCSVHCFSGMTGMVNVIAPFISMTSIDHDANGVTITGQTSPNASVTIEFTDNLMNQFGPAATRMANGAGVFSFTDMSAGMSGFYRASY